MFLITRLPDLSDPGYRARYSPRWGEENIVIAARPTRQAEYEPRVQPALSLKTVLEGEERYLVGGAEKCVGRHSFLVLNGGEVYGSRIESFRSVRSLSVFFAPELVSSIFGQARDTADEALDRGPGDSPGWVPDFPQQPVPIGPELRRASTRLQPLCDAPDVSPEELRETLVEVLSAVADWRLQRVPSEGPWDPATSEIERRLARAWDVVESSYARAWSLSELATIAELSPYHFLREYKRCFGSTPYRHLLRRRVEAARDLLDSTELDVSEIAALVGFNSRQAIDYQFRRRFGRSPGSFRGGSQKRGLERSQRDPRIDRFGVLDFGRDSAA